mmetsp:Transcript_31549/g.94080  ORF Transcript_31549/g.94080 Transcript_31549/m.94080 type:complete len:218 (-) Transcript_31549:990-1643(-)
MVTDDRDLRVDATLWLWHVGDAHVQTIGRRRVQQLADRAAELVRLVRLPHHVAAEVRLDLHNRAVDCAAAIVTCRQQRRQPVVCSLHLRPAAAAINVHRSWASVVGCALCRPAGCRVRRGAAALFRRPHLSSKPSLLVKVEHIQVVVELARKVLTTPALVVADAAEDIRAVLEGDHCKRGARAWRHARALDLVPRELCQVERPHVLACLPVLNLGVS